MVAIPRAGRTPGSKAFVTLPPSVDPSGWAGLAADPFAQGFPARSLGYSPDGLSELCPPMVDSERGDRKSTRLNSSHSQISYAVFCLKKKNRHGNYVAMYV